MNGCKDMWLFKKNERIKCLQLSFVQITKITYIMIPIFPSYVNTLLSGRNKRDEHNPDDTDSCNEKNKLLHFLDSSSRIGF